MSVQQTLDALATTLGPYLPGVQVLTAPNAIPYTGPLPALIITEYQDYVERLYAGNGVKGNLDGKPNIYSFVYIRKNAQRESTPPVPLEDVIAALRIDVEAIKVAFSRASVQGLTVGDKSWALSAGEALEFQYDRHGPFIEYLKDLYVGCYGLIDVMELVRYDTA